ncbi:hypothetical protein [Arthrobacter sp. DR-2P]|nr:hypothetical protein [Arthrobacter sp. DR-2P]
MYRQPRFYTSVTITPSTLKAPGMPGYKPYTSPGGATHQRVQFKAWRNRVPFFRRIPADVVKCPRQVPWEGVNYWFIAAILVTAGFVGRLLYVREASAA